MAHFVTPASTRTRHELEAMKERMRKFKITSDALRERVRESIRQSRELIDRLKNDRV